MGVPCDVSMRQLRRRFGCLTKLLSGYDARTWGTGNETRFEVGCGKNYGTGS